MPIPWLGVATITVICAFIQTNGIYCATNRTHLGRRQPLGQHESTVALDKHLDFLLESTHARMLNLLAEPGLVPVLYLLVLYVDDIVAGHKVVIDFVAYILADIGNVFMLTGKLLPTVPSPLRVLLLLVPIEHLAQVLQVQSAS